MAYIGSAPTSVVSRQSSKVYRYTATAGQTVFSGADASNQILDVTPSDTKVHINGLLLEPSDYTLTSSSVTLTTAAAAGDELTVTGFQTFEVADAYDKATADTRYVNASGDTMTGDLSVTGDVGINVTPSSWDSFSGRLQIGETAALANYSSGSNVQTVLGVNTYYQSGYKSIKGGADAGYINVSNSGFTYYRASSQPSSAGETLTFNKHIGVDTSGRVTMPYQPMFTATQSSTLQYGNDAKLAFDGLVNNIGSHFDLTNDRFTAPISGTYQFMIQASIPGMSNPGNYCAIYFKKNGGGTGYRFRAQTYNNTTAWTGISGTIHLKLNANDYVELWAYAHTGYISIQGAEVHFMGHLIG